MSKEKEKEKQHIVPQSYLRIFGKRHGNTDTYRIGVFNPKIEKHDGFFTSSIEKIGFEKYYYDNSNFENQYWENYFANNIEPLYGRTLINLMAKITMSPHPLNILSISDKEFLSKIIISQMYRVPAYLDKLVEETPKITSNVINEIINDGIKLTRNEYKIINNITHNEADIRDITLINSLGPNVIEKRVKVLTEKYWFIVYNNVRTEIPFITSDNPVIVYDRELNKVSIDNTIMGKFGANIVFPLSPTLLIGITGLNKSFMNKEWDIEYSNDIKYINNINCYQQIKAKKELFLPLDYYDKLTKINKSEG